MRLKLAAISFLISASASLTQASTNIPVIVEPSSSVSSNNRAAHFNWLVESSSGKEARIGQFACGSYWVAPAVGDTGVRLLSLKGSGKAGHTDLLSLDSDPLPHSHGLLGLGSKTYESHNAAQNDHPRLPILYVPKTGSAISLVAAMQRNESETSQAGTSAIVGAAVDAYCILTVMAEAPANNGADMIRPNFVGDKKEFLTWSDFDLTRLPSHSFIGADSSASLETQSKRWNHSTEIFSMKTWTGTTYQTCSEGGRAFRAHILHHNYGAGRAADINNSMVTMLGANKLDEKKPLLASLIAQGLDAWHLMYGRSGYPGAWASGAGQWGGQFMPAVFATALLKDPSKGQKLKQTAAHSLVGSGDQSSPQELNQIMRGATGVLLWGDGHQPTQEATTSVPDGTRRYWNDLKWGRCYLGAVGTCDPNVGKKTAADPHGFIDGPPAKPGTSYMGIAAGNQRSFAAIMLLFPKAREIVNSDDVIEYVDRLNRAGIWTAPDPLAAVPVIDQEGCDIWSLPGDGKGCSEYRYTWGPSADDARYGVENGVGRFPHMHGKGLGYAYTSTKAESAWSKIIALYDGSKYEDKFAPLGTCVAPDIIVSPEATDKAYMRSGTTDAKIYYTLDGTLPSASSKLYTGPFALDGPAEIRAVAIKSGHKNSKTSVYYYKVGAKATPEDPSDLNLSVD